MNRRILASIALASAVAASGCGGDMVTQMMSNPDRQAQVLDLIAADPDLAARTVDRLVASDTTRAVVIDRALANGTTAQALMARMATDRTRLEGIVNLAVQDSSTRDHLMTFFRGMQTGARPGAPN